MAFVIFTTSWSYKRKEAYEKSCKYQLQTHLHTTTDVLHCLLTSTTKQMHDLYVLECCRTLNEYFKMERNRKRYDILQSSKNIIYLTLQIYYKSFPLSAL